jgi:hypothetical protein
MLVVDQAMDSVMLLLSVTINMIQAKTSRSIAKDAKNLKLGCLDGNLLSQKRNFEFWYHDFWVRESHSPYHPFAFL